MTVAGVANSIPRAFFPGLLIPSVRHKVALADKGRAWHAIVVNRGASERTLGAAKDLADYLGRITGAHFKVTEGDGTSGIAVGTYKDFPKLKFKGMFDPGDLTRLDEYLLRTHSKGAYLIGATDLAAQHAVWGFLYRIGYRQFFPTDTWEVVPEVPTLNVEMDAFERPDFYNRNGPRISAYSDEKLWRRWHDRNRLTSSFRVDTGHSYNGIIARNKAAFDAHPEYLALVDGARGGGLGDKFCVANQGLRRLVVEDAGRRIQANPDATSISMDPSDGGSWCECKACAEMGSISDRVVILANEVAAAINEMGLGDKYVGMYAYNQHSPPPHVDVHPKVIVSIATSYIRYGYTFETLIEGWSKRARLLGIREYYIPFVWYQGMPLKGNGGNVNYLAKQIPYYHRVGARFMNADSGDSWIANGLGFYISARLLWNVNAARDIEGMIDDFVNKLFGKARAPMRNFFKMVAQDHDAPRTNEDLLAHMYGYIKEARALTDDPKTLARLDDMGIYTRYVELWFRFERAEGQHARDKAAQEVFRHAYRMQNTMMVDAQSLYQYLRRVKINVPEYADPGNLSVGGPLEEMQPWKSSKPFTRNEIEQFIEKGVAAYKKDNMGFRPVTFSKDLAPAAEMLNLSAVSMGDMEAGNVFRGRHTMFTWFRPGHKQLPLTVAGGLIAHYRDRGNVRFRLFSPQEALVEPVAIDETVAPNGETYNIVLKSPYDGMHELEWDDGDDQTRLVWAEGTPMTVRASMDNPTRFRNNVRLYFYVPKGVRIVGGYAAGKNIQIFDGGANKILDWRDTDSNGGYFNIPVPAGQDGALWQLRGANIIVRLMTVPPYLARNEKELLLPKEVIEADRPK